ncbi:Protein of unknown function [Gemmobacter aquatilis]|uniref:DUF3168 domain-containing protein n=1 Tax=Gemmobacter aquatilis TaxID=933059 RepID=A0A1H8P1I4_9RHOB|nr:DUF3168 domain-containing protein [Gemmobacter aquatilis]SEO35770.1 Protein of unknown function [Gemmobacter aquatilis]
MIEPGFALQALIGDRLAADPDITALVNPLNIRAGMIRPDQMPAIVLAPARVRFLGHAAGGQIMAEVRLLLHVWAVEDGAKAQAVAGAVMRAMMDAPEAEGFDIDAWARPELVWMRDPDPVRAHTQGVIALTAVLRWRAA